MMKKLLALCLILIALPVFAEFNVKTDNEYDLHCHQGFASYLNASTGVPFVVCWDITKDEVKAQNLVRKGSFKKCGNSLSSSYKGTRWQGRDRGHMCPCDDRNYNAELQKETFLMCNMVPQTPSMNRKTWFALERQTRKIAAEYGYVEVASGPIFERYGDIETCFKVLRYDGKVVCWICYDTFYRDSTLEEIEALTGLKLY